MSKKSETLEVRLSFELKEQLRTAAESRGASVSELVRDISEAYLLSPETTFSASRWWLLIRRNWKSFAGGLIGLIVLAGLMLAIVESDYFSSTARAFRTIDLNADGRIGEPELALHYGENWANSVPMPQIDIDGDRHLMLSEFQAWQLAIQLQAYQRLQSSDDAGGAH